MIGIKSNKIVLENENNEIIIYTIDELLPKAFLL